ncbi:MAG: hypothetical protein UT00_C0012G0007 [Parcubacteria group bacterium GW2011_GWA1_38_7]|nr:MAG: hypothetical protein UT00_C0012G0007 [Parcubacteria group bacterium GW2011_GWA1_38_7]
MVASLFNILFFLIPLIFFKNTSEIFEFNKIIVLYVTTLLISLAWIYKSISHQKIIFRRTILDIPIVFYLIILFLSTLLSTDSRTSWFGYYSRFNGGLFSQLCYFILYWACVSNLTKKYFYQILYSAIIGTFTASLLAILEHFNFSFTCGAMGLAWNNSCWVQDVSARVFSTFGQPNWLAAVAAALIPIVWSFSLQKSKRSIIFYFLFLIFLITIFYTKSRSGLLAVSLEIVIFWGFILFKYKKEFLNKLIINLLIIALCFVLIRLPSIYKKEELSDIHGPALETGGTESSTIRKYVWMGAINIFKSYPVLGTGPETFAFAFPGFKPVEHNLTSEWDFVYNKSHNEFLNILATIGILGFFSYLVLIIISLRQLMKPVDLKFKIGLISGYLGILTTNFFGFSVVYTSLLFFIFPALSVIYHNNDAKESRTKKFLPWQLTLTSFISLIIVFAIYKIYIYWSADINYNLGRLNGRAKNFEAAQNYLTKAIDASPNEPLYLAEMAVVLTETTKTQSDIDQVLDLSETSIRLSPYNQNLKRSYATSLSRLSKYDKSYLLKAVDVVNAASTQSKTDPKLFYQLGLLYLKTGQNEEGLKALEKAVELKPNYKEGRFALGLTYIDFEENEKARRELKYILENIDPNDELTKKYLDGVK